VLSARDLPRNGQPSHRPALIAFAALHYDSHPPQVPVS
jgi:hypothetical protein